MMPSVMPSVVPSVELNKTFIHQICRWNYIFNKNFRKRKKTRIWVWRSVLGFGHL